MKKKYTRKGGKIKVHYEETLNSYIPAKKGKIRDRVEKEVGDILDNQADMSKLLSFNTMVTALLYEGMYKTPLSQDQLDILDQGFELFNETDTIGKDNFNEHGLDSIKPLLLKLSKIRNIKNDIMGGTK